MIKLSKYHKIFILFWTGMLVVLFIKDSVPGGVSETKKDFNKNQFEITYLFPLGRTDIFSHSQKINAEPVYIKVYAPRKFKTVRVVIGAKQSLDGWQLGVQTGKGFEYALKDLEPLEKQTIEINIEHALYRKNTIRLILAHPDKESFVPLEIDKVHVFIEDHAESYIESWKRSVREKYD